MRLLVHRGRVTVAKLALDTVGIWLAYFVAFNLRFEGALPEGFASVFHTTVPLLIACRLFSILLLTRYRLQWRSTGLEDAGCLVRTTLLGTALFVSMLYAMQYEGVPRSVLLMEFFLSLNGLMASRLGARILWNRSQHLPWRPRKMRRVLVIGAGDAGQCIVRMIKDDNRTNLEPVGFIDDDPAKRNRRIHGVRVLGRVPEIATLVKRFDIQQVLIAIPSISSAGLNRIVNECSRTNREITIVPGLPQMLKGQRANNLIRKIRVEDLMERTPVQVNLRELAAYLEGERVLVTGAGGSIGSELCRQIAALRPERLIILGHGENSIFWIEQELRTEHGINTVPVIADIQDRSKLARVFREFRPTVVFHAAAHKHVPLMEQNPEEAIKNNVFGTRNLAELAMEHGTKRFVMISTDKAVNPTSVMGASKRVAEMIVQSLAQGIETRRNETAIPDGYDPRRADTATRFASVRFGNVLGSRGSVIPTMQKQIERGGPVTVTHPDMVRYFMTIPEAVQLVIQAGAMAHNGEVFVLDMGRPMKIMDLAKNLIRLNGFTPDLDIPIEVTGIRPGEKLFEEVLTAEEGTTKTTHQKILIARASRIDPACLHGALNRLPEAVQRSDAETIKGCLQELVPSYNGARKPGATEDKVATATTPLAGPPLDLALEQAQRDEEEQLAADAVLR